MPTFSSSIIVLATAFPDMTLRQAAMLFYCSEQRDERVRQVCELAEHFSWPRPVVSRAGIRLEEMGLVKRGEIAGDKRTCTYTVTRDGQRALAKAVGVKHAPKPMKSIRESRRALA